MCGRYRLTTKAEELAQRYHAQMAENLELSPSWNVAPGQDVLAVRLNPETGERSLDALHWGLIPHWAKDKKVGYRTLNARSESVDKAPAFRQAFRKRRCLVCADGFYEWRRSEAGRKVPYYFQLKTGEPFAFAGLWENWQDPQSGAWLRSLTILTTAANALVRETHDRMPVILPEAYHAAWLGERDGDLKAMLKPLDPSLMEAWEVSPEVNSPRHNGPQLIERYSGAQSPAPNAQAPDSA